MIKKLLSIGLITAAMAANAQQLANSDFETWSGSPSSPNSWGTLDKAIAASPLAALGATSFVTQSSSPYTGTYAATLTTHSTAIGSFPAALVYGNMVVNTSGPSPTVDITGQPFTGTPISATYYIKGTVIAGDSVPTIVVLTKWNSISGTRDTIGGGHDFVNSSLTSTYTQRTFAIACYPGLVPDTIRYIISSSTKTSSPSLGTSVTVDGVSLAYAPAGIATNHAASTATVAYPNPAINQITISSLSEKAKFATIYDLTGRLMGKQELFNKQANIDLNAFQNGLYIYVIADENNHILFTSKFSVSK